MLNAVYRKHDCPDEIPSADTPQFNQFNLWCLGKRSDNFFSRNLWGAGVSIGVDPNLADVPDGFGVLHGTKLSGFGTAARRGWTSFLDPYLRGFICFPLAVHFPQCETGLVQVLPTSNYKSLCIVRKK